MPPWLLLILTIIGLSLVVPLYVLGMTAGNWRRALSAWWQYGKVMAVLTLPGVLAWCSVTVWTPQP